MVVKNVSARLTRWKAGVASKLNREVPWESFLRRRGFSVSEARSIGEDSTFPARSPASPSWQLPIAAIIALAGNLLPIPFDSQPLQQFAVIVPALLLLSLPGIWYERRSLTWSNLVVRCELVRVLSMCSTSVKDERRRKVKVSGVDLIRVIHHRRKRLLRAARRVTAASSYLGVGKRNQAANKVGAGCGPVIYWAAAAPWDEVRRCVLLESCVRQLRHTQGNCSHLPYVEYPPGIDDRVFSERGVRWVAAALGMLRLPLVVAVVGAFATAVLRLFF